MAPHCISIYIGQIGLAEHRSAFRRNQPLKSGILIHCIINHHSFDLIDVKLIQNVTEGRLLNKLEEVEINSASTNSILYQLTYCEIILI